MSPSPRWLLGCALSLLLAACGGGGGSPGSTPGGQGPAPGTPGTPAVASLDLYASASQLDSAQDASVSFTVVTKDASNRAIPNQAVSFSASSGNLLGTLPAPTTGSGGEAITSVKLTPGTDPSNRDIVVTAVAGGVSQSISIPVQGTRLSLTGASAVLSGGSIAFSVKATDSAGRAVARAALSVQSAKGNPVAPAAGLATDALGVATFALTGNHPGIDTLTVSGLGTSVRSSVSVSADDFSFTEPAAGTSVPVGQAQQLRVRLRSGGVAQVGAPISFSTTRGGVSAATALTDASGDASTSVASFTSGPATVIATSASGAQISLPLNFVATQPATLVLQANPSSVPPNPAGSQANQSTVRAVVRDAMGNPVPGKTVSFSALADASGGVLSPGTGITDAGGAVSTQFIPGALATPFNGVLIGGGVVGTGVTGSTSLTVSGQALFIEIGVGNQISNYDSNLYQQSFAVYVTDVNGAPVKNHEVQVSVTPIAYRKGALEFQDPGGWQPASNPPITQCPNEDLNFNGELDAGEDVNGDRQLTPGSPATIAPSTLTTNEVGVATFFLRYGENYVPWLDVLLTARASVGGTESLKYMPYSLAGAASDFNNQDTPPAGVTSPFGIASSCSSRF